MEVSGYFINDEQMEKLRNVASRISDIHWREDAVNLSLFLGEILDQLEKVNGNSDTETEMATRELHGIGMDLWGEDNSPKVDVAAKLKARLILPK